MIGMQYKVILPKDYDMEIIRKRVQENSHKTDGFPGLLFKWYLITESTKKENSQNSYAPLYLWDNHEGMNKFIFEGYYDNILESFGWHQINISIPLSNSFDLKVNETKYVVEYAGIIPERKSLLNSSFTTIDKYVKNAERSIGNLLVYNPDKWTYSHFSFFRGQPKLDSIDHLTLYEVLHVSQ